MDALIDQKTDALASAIDRIIKMIRAVDKQNMRNGLSGALISKPEAVVESLALRRRAEAGGLAVQLRWTLRDLGECAAVNASDPDAALARIETQICHGRPDADARRAILMTWFWGLGRRGPYAKAPPPTEGDDE